MENTKKTVGSAQNAARIIKYLSQSGSPRRLVDISSALSINSSTCLNILRTLDSEGFVSKAGGKMYEIGPEMIAIGVRITSQSTIVPILDQITARHGISSLYWRRFGDSQLVLTACSHPEVGININATLGMRVPLLTGSMGRCIAGSGEFSREELKSLFEQSVWQNPLSFDEFMKEAEQTAIQGWSEEKGRYLDGINAVSVPVPSEDRRVARMVTAFGLARDLPEEKIPILAQELKRAAELISMERN